MREEVASNENPSIYVRRADKLGGGPQVKQHCIHFGVVFLVDSLRMSLQEDALGGGVLIIGGLPLEASNWFQTRHPFWSIFSSCKSLTQLFRQRRSGLPALVISVGFLDGQYVGDMNHHNLFPGGEEACALPLFWKVPLCRKKNQILELWLKSQESCTPWKINMEHNNGGLEDDSCFQLGEF